MLVVYNALDQYGNTTQALTRYHARSGAGVSLAKVDCDSDFPTRMNPSCTGADPEKAVLAATGAGALETKDGKTKVTTLQSFDRAGALARLDDGPVDKLSISGREIVWTRDGMERRAPLPD